MKLLISSCLLGEKTRYDGNHNLIDSKLFESIIKNNEIFSLCPELEGGLSTPRAAAEIKYQKVLTKDKKDLSMEFKLGAEKTLEFCKKHEIKIVLLKSKSPSCGNGEIYNGDFTKTLVKKSGITAALLKSENIKVFNENELKDLDMLINKFI